MEIDKNYLINFNYKKKNLINANFNENLFDSVFKDFDVNYYKKYKDISGLSNIDAKKHYFNIGRLQNRIYNNKIKIIIVCDQWNDDGKFTSGGNKALYNLGRLINIKGHGYVYAKMYDMSGKNNPNPFCNYYATKNEINKNTIVLYPDGTSGNPLNGSTVIRWILLEIGTNYRSVDFYKTWGPNDLVYHWQYGNKSPSLLKILNTCIIDDIYINKNKPRFPYSSCYMIKKRKFIDDKIVYVHPSNSIYLDALSKEDIVKCFNRCEYFYCYDLKTFFFIGAILCGCKVILVNINDSITKNDFIKESIFYNFPKFTNMFAWGVSDIKSINYNLDDINDLKIYLNNLSCSVEYFLADICKLYKSRINNHIPTVRSVYMNN